MHDESKALRLARYLREFVGLRTTTVKDISKYESVVWFADLPQQKGCESPAWIDGTDEGVPWLVVKKQQLPEPPALPELLHPWVDLTAFKNANGDAPPLRPTTMLPNPEKQTKNDSNLITASLGDHPDVSHAYEKFIPRWEAWRSEYRRLKAVQDIYATLFSLHTQVRKQNELVELIVGVGLLEWHTQGKNNATATRRHMVTAKADLHFDAGRGEMRLEPASDGCDLRIESDMLEAELRPSQEAYAAVNAQLTNLGDNIWDKSLMFTALKYWGQSLHADTQWSESITPIGAQGQRPSFSFSPALILRKRTQQGMIRVYQEMIDNISAENAFVPAGWGGLTTDDDISNQGDTPDDISFETENNTLRIPHEIYFPNPANREQKLIVAALNQRDGVVVQGPPGTGKSHTIANLVCHLLATGKRVLITAETARALQVLKNKLPSSMQALCVSLLGQGGDSFAELNTAVQDITTRHSAFNRSDYQDRISELQIQLDQERRSVADTNQELRKLREDEVSQYSFINGAYLGTASKIAERIECEKETYQWLSIPRDAAEEPTVSGKDMRDLLRILRSYDQAIIEEAQKLLPESSKLPSPSELNNAIQSEKYALSNSNVHQELRKHPAYQAIANCDEQCRNVLRGSIETLGNKVQPFIENGDLWGKRVIADYTAGKTATWLALFERSTTLFDSIRHTVKSYREVEVSFPESMSLRGLSDDAHRAADLLAKGKNWKTLGMLKSSDLKQYWYIRETVRVNGKVPVEASQMSGLATWLKLQLQLNELKQAWADTIEFPSNDDLHLRLTSIQEIIETLRFALAIGCEIDACCHSLGSIPKPQWLAGEAVQWLEMFDAAQIEAKYSIARNSVESSIAAVEHIGQLHNCHPIARDIKQAIISRNVEAYSQHYERLLYLEKIRSDVGKQDEIINKTQLSVPGLVDILSMSIDAPEWDTRFESWNQAWHWCFVNNWLTKRVDFNYQRTLIEKRKSSEIAIAETLTELAENKAWVHFFDRLSKTEASALKSWREAVRAMGKGTGKSNKQARLKREARLYMETCRNAIPVWIMPRYLVAEMVDPKPNRFDLIIIDEASQLGIDSLFLFYIGKKLIVVGDDQQISPYGVGISDDAIAGLQQHYLEDIPHQHALSAQSSLYGNAKIRYQHNIVLREHFRCMPEIIQFSNDLCYAPNGTPLDPLRTYTANRLQPIVVRHVKTGYRKGSSQHAVNPPEADAIVEQICACIEDPRYENRDIGVISLQGDTQAKLIEQKLLQVLDPEVIEKRRIICGDSYAFQGDERSIIFLSMVAAQGDTRIATLSNDSARQRFNVAVSRAQDQIWLFHSVELDELSDKCMRYRLLKYMLNPTREEVDQSTQRFDSEFERKVFERITAKGYHVRTQVAVGAPLSHRYRIDLVVEGMQGRLAVECDGDQWHGPDRYEQDMSRQRDLERVGWHFVRIRGGDFYRNPDVALEPLWSELAALGISPGGMDEPQQEPPAPKTIEHGTIEFEDLIGSKTEASNSVRKEVKSSSTAPNFVASHNSTPHIEPHTVEPYQAIIIQDEQSQYSPDIDSKEHEPSSSNDDQLKSIFINKPTQDNSIALQQSGKIKEVILKPYEEYQGPPWGDPRNVNIAIVAAGLRQIIKAEGPMIAKRAYDIYLRNCGIKRMGHELKSTMNKALQTLITANQIISIDESQTGGLIYSTVRLESQPYITCRELGSRSIHEIPLSELKEVLTMHMLESCDATYDIEECFRSVLSTYGLIRMTTETKKRLESALKYAPCPPQNSTLKT